MTGKELFDALELANVQAGNILFPRAWIKADAATQQAFDIAAARLTKAEPEPVVTFDSKTSLVTFRGGFMIKKITD